MAAETNWIIVEIDGKISAVSPDFSLFAEIAGKVAALPVGSVNEVSCRKASTKEVAELSENLKWDDLRLFGSDFQKHVWKTLFGLTHGEKPRQKKEMPYSDLISYSDFARLCGNEAGTRAVAHAVALNPVAIIIPCHLVVPKESIDKIRKMEAKVAPTLFANWLLANTDIYFGEYRYGHDLKKHLIAEL